MIGRLLHYSSPAARRLLVTELVFIVATAVLQGVAFLMLVPLLRALFLGDMATVQTWLIALTGVAVGYAIAFWFASQIGMKASTVVLQSLLERLGDRLVELPIAWFATDRSGLLADVATRGTMFVASTPYAIVRLILTGFITPATVLVGMYFFDWRLALAMTATAPVMWAVFRWLTVGMKRDSDEHIEAIGEASNRVIEFARVQPALRTAGDSSTAERLVEQALQRQHRAYRGLLVTGGAGIAVFAGFVQLALTAIIVLGAYLALGGSLEPATLIALLVLGVRFTEPISQSGALGGGVAVARSTLSNFDDLYAVAPLPEPDRPGTPADWGIEFRDVTFGYGGAPVLDRLSFTAPSRRMTAIVGPSGSGKTTITRLIARFYDPEQGGLCRGHAARRAPGLDRASGADRRDGPADGRARCVGGLPAGRIVAAASRGHRVLAPDRGHPPAPDAGAGGQRRVAPGRQPAGRSGRHGPLPR